MTLAVAEALNPDKANQTFHIIFGELKRLLL